MKCRSTSKEKLCWVVCCRRMDPCGKECPFAEPFQISGNDDTYILGECTHTEEQLVCIRIPAPKK